MPLQSIEPRRLYRQIADQIRTLIASGEYATGARLPPERDLARQLGVSRPSVREALIALEVEGRVEVRIGSGIYVQAAAPRTEPVHEEAFGPFELLRARWVIESECAALAARSARKEQVQAIDQALARMERDARAGAVPLEGDREFHLAVAGACGNAVLVSVVRMLWEERRSPLFTRLEHHFDTPEIWARAIGEHRDVLRAIRSRDAEAARESMQRHMDQAARRFSRGWNAQKEG